VIVYGKDFPSEAVLPIFSFVSFVTFIAFFDSPVSEYLRGK